MRWLRQIRTRLRRWRDNHEAAALLSDIGYHQRAECHHRAAAWCLTQQWREQQKKATLSLYAVAAWGIKPADAKQAEEHAHNIVNLDQGRDKW